MTPKQKYLLNNPEKRRESCRKYYLKNKDKIKERTKEYRESVAYKTIRKNSKHKRRARESETDITKDWLLDLMARTKECMMCDCELTDKNRQLDHITPLCVDGAHTTDNVRYVCAKCNQSRPKDGRDEIEKAELFIQKFIDIHTSI